MSSLPPEIITSILSRLPVKSLLRFRCVSKPWCSQIDSRHFINLHHSHSITTGSNHSLITQSEGTFYSLDSESDTLNNFVKIETPFPNPNETFRFSICNGFILVQAWLEPTNVNLILFNPSTRKHLVLPTPPPKTMSADNEISYHCLGYDVVNDDYKVFNILVFADQDENFIACEAQVYSLKSNEWHIVKDFAQDILVDSLLHAYVNGALHTVNDEYSTIVALDVCKVDFNLMPFPNVGYKNLSRFVPYVFDGCLAILCQYANDRTDIWVMKEYGVKESWGMLLSVKPEISDLLVTPLIYSKSRDEVLLSYGSQKLVWYDLRTNIVRGFEVSGLPIGYYQVCVESLVSVGGTSKTDEKKKQHGDEK